MTVRCFCRTHNCELLSYQLQLAKHILPANNPLFIYLLIKKTPLYVHVYTAVIDKSVNKQRIVNDVSICMCSRRFYNVSPEVSGCPNLGSSYEDKKKLIHLHEMLVALYIKLL